MSIGVSIRCIVVVGQMFLSRIFVKKLQGRLCYRCLFPAAQCSVLSWCLRVGCFSELRCVRLPEPSALMNGLIHSIAKAAVAKGRSLELSSAALSVLGHRRTCGAAGGREVISASLWKRSW